MNFIFSVNINDGFISLQALTKERRSLPRIFDNLGHICIQSTCLNDGLVTALASLFRGMRHLNTFHLKYEPIIPLLFTKHVEVITVSLSVCLSLEAIYTFFIYIFRKLFLGVF